MFQGLETYIDRIGRLTRQGKLTEFPLAPGSRSWDITNGPDGNLWFTAFGNGKIGYIIP